MCAKYGVEVEFNLLERTYRLQEVPNFLLSGNTIFPHTPGLAIYENMGPRKADIMNFGLIPSWSKERKPKFASYNARIETVMEKPTWKAAFKNRHCLVPISVFYESVYEGDYAGNTISIRAEKSELMTAAGIWESWTDKTTGEIVNSYAILTTEPPLQIRTAGHDRCPIFLKSNAFSEWLIDDPQKNWIQFLETNSDSINFTFKAESKLKSFEKKKI